jgi:hypothetical protein
MRQAAFADAEGAISGDTAYDVGLERGDAAAGDTRSDIPICVAERKGVPSDGAIRLQRPAGCRPESIRRVPDGVEPTPRRDPIGDWLIVRMYRGKNGTFNGTKPQALKLQMPRGGDELRCGKMIIKLYFE